MAKRIEICDSFEQMEEATLLTYINMTPIERWIFGHELSKNYNSPPEEGVFCLYPENYTPVNEKKEYQ